MNEKIEKFTFKIKKLTHRIVIDEKEIIDENSIVEKFNLLFANIGPKLPSN